ncbi:TonB-dependent receptor [Marilutibacter spongiae]|uniref:TonB-dependent receptor n=1 Tax=Marilutibacter spongiae TaxID=2025720 RepID=A0A7W3Y5V9_9GAMM|nr:TonB-dependent receptor [Lysobacter spongiae]MBB1060346.1 TonB-dependent receptor [Lysobacter spongiae]
MTHPNRVRLSRLTLGLLAVLATAPVFAQSTSAGIGGVVTDASGQPVQGANVTITHVESGTVSRTTTDDSGRYNARGLRVGGPYTVTITAADGETTTEDNVYLDLNRVNAINAQLDGGDAVLLDTVSVTASSDLYSVFSPDNKGVGTSVAGRVLELTPQANRSLDDVARLDPRVQVTDAGDGSISVAGVNNRFNNISVDGMSQGDPFGLNANGMPYIGTPISVDTIDAYDIKVADYDVGSDTVGATVNAVTKSGTNEFHGSVYGALRDADWMGDLDGDGYQGFDNDRTFGATLGGPILKDRLFFFGSYEEQTIKNFGGSATSDGVANGDVTQADVDRAIAIAESLGMQPGSYGATGVNLETKRYLAKLDWNISDFHRASLTYQQTEEFRPSPYDAFSDTVVLTSHWYNIDNVTKNTSLQLFSDWTENFSTEAKISYNKFDQVNGNPIDQPEVEIETANGGSIFIGEDNNRHENQINTERVSASIFGTYYAGDHVIKGGFDYLRHDVFNLYGRDLHGSYVFESLDDFAAGDYDVYNLRTPAPGFGVDDTAAALVYSQWSPYLQDTWQVNDNLSLTYGVRVNIPSVDKAPVRNDGFEQAFGFRNDYKLGSDNKVVLPRVSFNYMFDTDRFMQLRGGLGSFQSVPPFVWLANPYQNNGGMTAVSYRVFDPTEAPFSPDPYNQNVPAGGSPSNQIDTIDPDFKLPTVWKASLGFDAELPWYGMIGTVELQSIQARDAAFYKALNIGQAQGTLADGRESYWCTLGNTSSSNKNCGRNPDYSFNSTVLDNTDKGGSNSLTLSLSKPMSNGWYGNISYTYTDADEVGSDASSQAWSSYQYVSRVNPNQEIATTASREIPNSIKASLGWEHAFFGDYKSSVSLFYYGRDGLPYTWLVNGDANGDGIFQDPAYIPLVNDPNVSYGGATAEQIEAFHRFIANDPYLQAHRGQIAGRNEGRLPWVNQLDLGLQQELPGFFADHKSTIRLDIYNVLNLLNKDWGVTDEIGGFDTRYLARLGGVNADGTYVYDLGTPDNPSWQDLRPYEGRVPRVVSRWAAQLTLRYEF